MQSSSAVVVLRAREMIRLEQAAGTQLRVRHGSVWITQCGDHKDYYLPENGAITLDRRGLALIHALKPAELIVSQPAPRPSLGARVARTLAGWAARRFGPEGIENQRLNAWHRVL
ncbi:MAG TPA: DUF2917 domain-containing protein [Burkholderiales bacterium]|nr:DUF2917 domain-containing protein [Burkholderiales bacterium]